MSTLRESLALNGEWMLTPDPRNLGVYEEWFAGRAGELVSVPCQRRFSEHAEGPLWFFRHFDAPALSGRHAELTFESAGRTGEVWLNGRRLGDLLPAPAPSSFIASACLVAGENLLAVRLDAGTAPALPAGVALHLRPKAHLDDILLQPDLRRKRLTVRVAAPEGVVRAEILGTEIWAEGAAGELGLDFPELVAWSPEHPERYTLRLSLLMDGAVADVLEMSFGMREFTVKDNRFHLNNRPVHIKAVRHALEYPEEATGAEVEALMRREIGLVKEAGFNLIAVDGGAALGQFLDVADALGILVWVETVDHAGTPALAAQLRNHPALCVWGIDDPVALREADPSRLVLLPRGPMRAGGMIRPYRSEREPYDDVRLARRAPVGANTEDTLHHCGQPEQLSFLAEFGYGGLSATPGTPEAEAARASLRAGHAARDLSGVIETPEAVVTAAGWVHADAVRYQIDAARSNTKLAGYCWTRLCDGARQFAGGLLDLHRNPKPAHEAAKRIQSPMRPLITMTMTNLRPRQEVPVTVLLANEERLEGRCEISLQVVGPTNQVLWKKRRASKLPRHGKELWTGAIGASGSTGKHRFIVRVIQEMKVIAEAGQDFYVFESATPGDVRIQVVDPRGDWSARCERWARLETSRVQVHVVPPLANSVRMYPDQELLQTLAQVKGGAAAIIFGAPRDWNDLAERLDENLCIHTMDALGGMAPAYHYLRLHPAFDGLLSRCLMRQGHRYVAPQTAYTGASDEDIAGVVNMSLPDEEGRPGMWGHDILVRRYGSGRIAFTHLRVLENLGLDPLADRLFVNLLTHLARRSVPPAGIEPTNQKALEWMRLERTTCVRRWVVLGAFANWGGAGHTTAYPPENGVDITQRYAGWFGPIGWRNWATIGGHEHDLDLHAAVSYVPGGPEETGCGTVYAYAEFTAERRQETKLRIITAHAIKVWLNGALIVEGAQPDDFRPAWHRAETFLRQGRNTLLIKSSQTLGEHQISVCLESGSREPLQLSWWR